MSSPLFPAFLDLLGASVVVVGSGKKPNAA